MSPGLSQFLRFLVHLGFGNCALGSPPLCQPTHLFTLRLAPRLSTVATSLPGLLR
jgi:hypothetical protein